MVKGTVFFLVDIDHPTLFYLVDSRGPSTSILQPFSSRPICMIKNTNVIIIDLRSFLCKSHFLLVDKGNNNKNSEIDISFPLRYDLTLK